MARHHGQVTYRMTQVFTGHGCFGNYLARIGRLENPRCPLCDEENDDAEHVLFDCPAMATERWKQAYKHGTNWTVDGLGPSMLLSKSADDGERWLVRREELENASQRTPTPALT